MLGIYSAEERQRHLETGSYEPLVEISEAQSLMTQSLKSEHHAAAVEIDEVEGEVVDEAPVETKDTHGSEAREVPAHQAKTAHTSAELMEQITGHAVDSPLCFTCGTKMRPAGSCYVCEGCGSTSGCS